MDIVSAYSVGIKKYNRIFNDSVRLYRKAVDFYIDLFIHAWPLPDSYKTQKDAVRFAEHLSVVTKKNPDPLYHFDRQFYKFPCYLRRAAIAEAYGKVCSYESNLRNWQQADKKTRGAEPSIPKAGYVYPALYHDNCYVRLDTYTAKVKVFTRSTWDWLTVQLRKSDVDYILHHCQHRKECTPTLQKRGHKWYLDFPFKESVKLNKVSIYNQTALAVDLGLNNACTCSILRSDGTVVGRKFLKLPSEYDCLQRRVSRIKHAQRHGSRNAPVLWKFAEGINNNIAVKTAQFIIDTAVLYNADVIVMEHLDFKGKLHGSKKQKLHLWKARYVQSMVENKAHRLGIRVSHVNAWGTSRLAFDGTGRVLRGRESRKTNNNYSLCEFSTGKVYNCDLNASYNIGSRYFVREIIKSLPVTLGQGIQAKVPACLHRSTCTLSTLISLNGELHASA